MGALSDSSVIVMPLRKFPVRRTCTHWTTGSFPITVHASRVLPEALVKEYAVDDLIDRIFTAPARRRRGLLAFARTTATQEGRSRHPLSWASMPATSPFACAWINASSASRSVFSVERNLARRKLTARNSTAAAEIRTMRFRRAGLVVTAPDDDGPGRMIAQARRSSYRGFAPRWDLARAPPRPRGPPGDERLGAPCPFVRPPRAAGPRPAQRLRAASDDELGKFARRQHERDRSRSPSQRTDLPGSRPGDRPPRHQGTSACLRQGLVGVDERQLDRARTERRVLRRRQGPALLRQAGSRATARQLDLLPGQSDQRGEAFGGHRSARRVDAAPAHPPRDHDLSLSCHGSRHPRHGHLLLHPARHARGG